MHFKTNYTFQNNKGDKGFSLIEVAVGIIILGLLIGGLFQAYSTYIKQKTADMNFESHDKITQALALYLQENGAFPCPADPTLTPANADFGKEMVDDPDSNPDTEDKCDGYVKGGVAIGTVPVYDLNIPFTQISDAYGNKITYAVTEALTHPLSFDSSREIEVETSSGATQEVQFVLVSHGADKKGAFLRLANTTAYPCGDTSGDSQNCDWADELTGAGGPADAVRFVDNDIATQPDPTNVNHFDDMLTYSLAMGESTLWGIARNGTNGLNVVNRDISQVGIGTDSPNAKLHVSGGNIIVAPGSDGTGGSITAEKQITASGKITATNDVRAGNEMRATTFYYD